MHKKYTQMHHVYYIKMYMQCYVYAYILWDMGPFSA